MCTDDVYRGEWAHIFRWSVHAAKVYPPGSDIWWPRVELGHLQMMCIEENELIFWDEVLMQLKFTPLVVTSGGQE